MEECGNGFDQRVKEILHGYVQKNLIKKADHNKKQNRQRRLNRLELWQKAYEMAIMREVGVRDGSQL